MDVVEGTLTAGLYCDRTRGNAGGGARGFAEKRAGAACIAPRKPRFGVLYNNRGKDPAGQGSAA